MTIERAARALWLLECRKSDETYFRVGREPPRRWADPWDESGCGVRQQKEYLEQASAALDAIADPTLEMVEVGWKAAAWKAGVHLTTGEIASVWRAMHAAMMKEGK